ncbi:hypothetical protein [Sphingomonas jatrophae]|uniref:Uncharacterized protein n=1 Tax=Sphingomonas jatrophae TaxID=1166337 RepID=A0A1I6KYM0_9SPHN|nr:hypothetical protein [Sphingomonas jatrophae]SFR96030.1 hypothetical protein SAMN05192580_1907 [Sphingomonas jatrophae]
MLLPVLLLLAAAEPEVPVDPPQRISTLVVFGDDPCPTGSNGEIVVCARRPEGERYRLPKRFRESKPAAGALSWSGTAASLDQVGRTAAGTPDSCSPVGSGGQTGCQRAFLRQAREERRMAEEEAGRVPGR